MGWKEPARKWIARRRPASTRAASSCGAIFTWAYQRGVTLDFSQLGKPNDNAFIEVLEGRFRAECLNTHSLLSLAAAQGKVETWCKYSK
ncbi:integrase core domain-containing protein [Bradyrhizobium sp. CCBAU 11361]|uniref:integrase core domain-containing protein n=1 Tax=Bradyrhizobium sp. CCBAU 11361 TaxID=1630812 RepID=UPI003FA485B6